MIAVRIVGLILSTGFCISAALTLRRSLRLEGGSAGVLILLLLFTAVQSLLILAAGLTGALSFWPLAVVGGIGWAILQLRPLRTPLGIVFPRDRSARALLAIGAVGLGALVVKSFVLGPCTHDALSYHLPKIAEWVQAGRFVWSVNHDPRQWFSAGFELIETWWVVFLRHDRLIELGGVQMALIAASAMVTLAETMGARPGFAAIVYLFVPAVILHATSCGNDLAAAALILAAYALVAAGAPRPAQALALFLGVGVKATVGFAAIGVVAFALFRERPSKAPRWTAPALTALGLLLGAFWYVRNFAISGNALYPMYGSHGEFTWIPQGGFDPEALQATVQVLPLRMLDRFPQESLCRLAAGWGWAVLPLGLPALVLALREDRRYRILALCFSAGAGMTLACSPWGDANLRFILWFPALFALSLARQRSWPWVTAALLACAVNFAATLIPYELRHSRHLGPPASLPPDTPVACVFMDSVPSYRLYNSDFSRRVTYPRSMEELRRSGAKVVYLYEAPEWAEPIRRWPVVEGKYHEVR